MSETNIGIDKAQIELSDLTLGRRAYGIDLHDMHSQIDQAANNLGLKGVKLIEPYQYAEDYNHDEQIADSNKHHLTIVRQSEVRSNLRLFKGILDKGYSTKDMVNEIRAYSMALSARRTIDR